MPRRQYPRTARLNEVLREVLAERLEEFADDDERLDLVTITGVQVDADLHHATVFYTARHEGAGDALAACRVRLQAAVAREVRLKRTPQLSFMVDPGVTSGWRIEEILKDVAGQGSRDAGEHD
ncbi:MAG TPA: ribosome-binding factor A [Acidimicrobiales bacterium]|nr:ribosome-binding factor A [Acidimicrobiales bacterium]